MLVGGNNKKERKEKKVQNLPEKCTMDYFGPFRKDAARQKSSL